MKKLLSSLVALSVLSAPAQAYTIYENTQITKITDGVTHQQVDTFSDTGWRTADVIRIDLTDENLEIKVMTSPDGSAHLSTVKTMAENYGTKAAVNADFFNMQSGETNMLGMLYQDGKLVSTPSKDNFVSFVVTDENKVVFDYFTFNGTLYAEHTSLAESNSCELYQINKVPVTTGGITMLTSAWGKTAFVPASCYAMICSPSPEGDDKYVMTGLSWGNESVSVPENGAVFVANYSVNAFLNYNFAMGDVIRVETTVTPDVGAIKEASGGNTLIVEDGKVCNFTSNITGKAQRTAMGISASGKTLVLATVDGRQTDSKGFNQTDLAEFMIALGCDKAINLDGGGSTTMVTQDSFTGNQVVKNEVSSLRKVSTAVGVVSHYPTGAVTDGEIRLSSDKILLGDSVDLSYAFYDEHLNKVTVDPSDVVVSCSDPYCIINGSSVMPTSAGVHTICVQYNSLTLTAALRVLNDIFAINIYPETASVESSSQSFTVTAYDRSGYAVSVPSSLLQFQTTGTIVLDGNSVLKGSGSGTLTAKYENLTSVAAIGVSSHERPADVKLADTFEGTFDDGEKITVTGKILSPKNYISRLCAKSRLSSLITRGDVYALSDTVYDPWHIFTVYRKTNGFTERVIDDTKIITVANTNSNSIRLTDDTAWGKIKTVCETITQKNIVFIMNNPIYSANEGEKTVWDHYMKTLTDKGVNVFVVSTGVKSEATVDNGVRYLYVGSLDSCTNQSHSYNLQASLPLTLTFKNGSVRYSFN